MPIGIDIGLIDEYFRNVERSINSNTIVLERQPVGYLVPQITALGGHQICPNDQEAFVLDPIINPGFSQVIKTDADKKIIIVRRALGYSTAARIASDPNSIAREMAPFITEMLLTLKQARGFGHETLNAGVCYGRFKTPGVGSYLLEFEEIAGYEVRLYSDTWSCIALPEESNDTSAS